MSILPKFAITIDDDYAFDGEELGIDMIANTATPAIKVKGFAFTNQEPKLLAFADNLKYRIAGPIMIPGDIYRCDEGGFEYEVSFTIEEIERIHSKFMSKNKNKDIFNIEHDNENIVQSYILEAFLVDSQTKIKMIKDEYNIDVPIGTSFVVQQFTDKYAYNKIVEEGKIGFSIEGYLALKIAEEINNNKQFKKQKMEEKLMLPAGEYVMGDKIYVVAEDGTFTIKDKETEVAMAEEVIEEEVKLSEEVIKEEELAEELPVVAEAPVAVVESYTKEEVDEKLKEIYQMIADIKAEEVTEEVIEEGAIKSELKFSVNSRGNALDSIQRFLKK